MINSGIKRICAFTAAIALAGALVSCGGGDSSEKETSPAAATTADSATETSAETTTTAETEAATQTSSQTETTAPAPEQPDEEDPYEINAARFEAALEGVTVTADDTQIIETGEDGGEQYSLSIDLSNWAQYTTAQDMVELSRLFWQTYPRMYRRFGDITGAPKDVTLAIENEGYEIAEAGGDHVHIHDQWLYNNPGDYDCITHELGHIAQDGVSWQDDTLEYSYYTELFVDCLRYEYSLDDGYYNDDHWTLHTPDGEGDRSCSVRFFVWLDYNYSENGVDILRRFCEVCYGGYCPTEQWDSAWEQIFSGTALEGKSIDDVWEMYAQSEFAYLSSYADMGERSELEEKFDIREKVKSRE